MEITTDELYALADQYQSSALLLIANETGLFEETQNPCSYQEVAQRLGWIDWKARIFLDALAALGILRRLEDRYQNVPSVARLLVRSSPDFYGQSLRLNWRLWNTWLKAAEILGSSQPVPGQLGFTSASDTGFMGPFQVAMAEACQWNLRWLQGRPLWSDVGFLIDLGGGHGTHAVALAAAHPQIRAEIWDLAACSDLAQQRIADASVGDRVSFVPVDLVQFMHEGQEHRRGQADCVLISHVLHHFSASDMNDLLSAAVALLAPHGRLLVVESYLASSRMAPVPSAIFSSYLMLANCIGGLHVTADIVSQLQDLGLSCETEMVGDDGDEVLIVAGGPDSLLHPGREPATMHTSPSTTVIYDRSGVLFSGGYDGQLIRWDADGLPAWSASVSGLINSLAICGDYVLAVGADRRLYAFDAATGAPQAVAADSFADDLNAVRVTGPDGTVVVAGDEGVVYLVRLDSPVPVWALGSGPMDSYGESIEALEVLQAGAEPVIFFADGSGRLGLVDLAGQVTRTGSVTGTVECCAVRQGHRSVLLGMSDGRIMEVATGDLSVLRTIDAHDLTVKALAESGETGRVASVSYDNQLTLWSPDLQLISRWPLEDETHRAWARALAFHPQDASLITITSLGARPETRRLEDGTLHRDSGSRSHGVNCLLWQHGKLIAGCDDGRLWEVLGERPAVLAELGSMVLCIAEVPGRYMSVAGSQDGGLAFVDTSTGTLVRQVKLGAAPVVSIASIEDLDLIAVGQYSGELHLLSASTLAPVHQLKLADSIKSLAAIGQPGCLAAATADGSVSIIDARAGIMTATRPDLFLPNAVTWNPAAQELLTVGRDLFIRRWTQSLDCLQAIPAHQRSIKAISVAPGGRHWATTGYDGLVCLWDQASLSHTMTHGGPGVPALAWLDSRIVASGGWDGVVRLWDTDGGSRATVALG